MQWGGQLGIRLDVCGWETIQVYRDQWTEEKETPVSSSLHLGAQRMASVAALLRLHLQKVKEEKIDKELER